VVGFGRKSYRSGERAGGVGVTAWWIRHLHNRLSALVLSSSLLLGLCAAQTAAAQQSSAESAEQSKESYFELYVNSKDQKHFSAVVERAVRVQQGNTIPIAAMFHIGDFNVITPEISAKLSRARIKLFALSGVPSDLPITTSPAWVFVTLTGRRIVEGTFAIERFIDARGAYRDGSQIPDPAAGVPTQPAETMEGF
jgi:hypothetical protein